jgi:hypothetical protein
MWISCARETSTELETADVKRFAIFDGSELAGELDQLDRRIGRAAGPGGSGRRHERCRDLLIRPVGRKRKMSRALLRDRGSRGKLAMDLTSTIQRSGPVDGRCEERMRERHPAAFVDIDDPGRLGTPKRFRVEHVDGRL